MHNHTCPDCGNEFTSANKRTIYCTPQCGWRFKARRNYAKNSAAINARAAELTRIKRTSERDPNTSCGQCGSPLESPSFRFKYCSTECSGDARRERKNASRSNWPSAKLRNQGNTHKRRAAEYGVAYEHVDKYKVYERDGWRCGICEELIHKALTHPHPQSPSLDHILPMVKGGAHSYENTQASHLWCNLSKHDEVPASA